MTDNGSTANGGFSPNDSGGSTSQPPAPGASSSKPERSSYDPARRRRKNAGWDLNAPDASFLGNRIPPNDLEAEKITLSAMMQAPASAEIGFELLSADAFYYTPHRQLFEIMLKLFNENRMFDWFTLKRAVEAQGLLEPLGGDIAFLDLMNAAPNSAMIDEYALIVKQRAIQRAAVSISTNTLKAAYDPAVEMDDLIDTMETSLREIAQRTERSAPIGIQPLLNRTMAEVDEAMKAGVWTRDVVPTGYESIDRILGGGLHRGELILLAARPSVGKTTMAINLLRKISCRPPEANPLPSLFFSLEMPAQTIANNILCAESSIPGAWLRRRMLNIGQQEMTEAGFQSMDEVMSALWFHKEILEKSPVEIDDGGALSAVELRSKARRRVDKDGVQIIFVDYLQLMSTPSGENRNQEISKLSRQLKQLARELNVPLVVLSQLRRPDPAKETQKPVISDLRESGALEQDADVVMLLHREDYQAHRREKLEEKFEEADAPLEVIIGKNRNGETGVRKLTFLREKYQIENYFPGDPNA